MLEWKELVKRFRSVQYSQDTLIKDLQLQVEDINRNFKSVAEYLTLGDDALADLTSRVEALEVPAVPHNHDDRYYTEAEVDSLLAAYYTALQVDALVAASIPDSWAVQPIGVPISVMTDIVGVAAPPTGAAYRYVKLTAADAYNTGIVVSESVTGVAPDTIATGVISLTGSPLDGQTVSLINTERRFLRAGSAGTKEQSQNLAHIHTGNTSTDGNHSHSGGAAGSSGGGGSGVPEAVVSSTGAAGAHNHTLNINPSGGTEARPANIGVTYFMRIK